MILLYSRRREEALKAHEEEQERLLQEQYDIETVMDMVLSYFD